MNKDRIVSRWCSSCAADILDGDRRPFPQWGPWKPRPDHFTYVRVIAPGYGFNLDDI